MCFSMCSSTCACIYSGRSLYILKLYFGEEISTKLILYAFSSSTAKTNAGQIRRF